MLGCILGPMRQSGILGAIDFAPEAQSRCWALVGPLRWMRRAARRAEGGNAGVEGGNAGAEGSWRGAAAHFWGTVLAFYGKFVPLRLIGLVYV